MNGKTSIAQEFKTPVSVSGQDDPRRYFEKFDKIPPERFEGGFLYSATTRSNYEIDYKHGKFVARNADENLKLVACADKLSILLLKIHPEESKRDFSFRIVDPAYERQKWARDAVITAGRLAKELKSRGWEKVDFAKALSNEISADLGKDISK